MLPSRRRWSVMAQRRHPASTRRLVDHRGAESSHGSPASLQVERSRGLDGGGQVGSSR